MAILFILGYSMSYRIFNRSPAKFNRYNTRASLSSGVDYRSLFLETESDFLEAYYPCDDESGNLVDATGNGFDLVPVGPGFTYEVEGQAGNAVQLDGNTWARVASFPRLPEGDFTICILANITSLATVDVLWYIDASSPSSRVFLREANPDTSQVEIQVISGGVTTNLFDLAAGTFVADEWHLYTLRRNGSSVILRKDNSDTSLGSHSGTASNTANSSLTLGASFTNIGTIPMKCQHFALWSKALSVAQLESIVSGLGLS